jgi:DNA ligase-1
MGTIIFRMVTCLLFLFIGEAWAEGEPAVTLAKVYVDGRDPSGYYVSEKFDGVRGYWDGKHLLTRGGNVIVAPAWFTNGWPAHPLDGELWAGRGRFAEAVSTVRSQVPDDAAWHRIHYMLFDLPAYPGPFRERVAVLPTVVAVINQPWVLMIPQVPATTAAALKLQLRQVVKAGGEGLALHRAEALYLAGRSDDLLKYKPYLDAEARVIGHLAGHGKYTGLLGALEVEAETGQRFRLGTGFSEQERRQPPAIGTWVTYRYRDVTTSGLPRFASYLRVRVDREEPPADPKQ